MEKQKKRYPMALGQRKPAESVTAIDLATKTPFDVEGIVQAAVQLEPAESGPGALAELDQLAQQHGLTISYHWDGWTPKITLTRGGRFLAQVSGPEGGVASLEKALEKAMLIKEGARLA